MTTFNTNTDYDERHLTMGNARHTAKAQIRHVIDLLSVAFASRAGTGEDALSKSLRREAARRRVDNLLR